MWNNAGSSVSRVPPAGATLVPRPTPPQKNGERSNIRRTSAGSGGSSRSASGPRRRGRPAACWRSSCSLPRAGICARPRLGLCGTPGQRRLVPAHRAARAEPPTSCSQTCSASPEGPSAARPPSICHRRRTGTAAPRRGLSTPHPPHLPPPPVRLALPLRMRSLAVHKPERRCWQGVGCSGRRGLYGCRGSRPACGPAGSQRERS